MKNYLAIILIALFVLVVNVSAQEATSEASATPVVAVVAEATQDVVVDEGSIVIVQTPDSTTDSEEADEPWWAKYAVQLIIFGGLIVGALKGLNAFLANRLANQQFMQSAEYAYRAITPDSVETGIDNVLVGLAKELELFGGNASKFLSQLGTKGDVIAQRVEETKKP